MSDIALAEVINGLAPVAPQRVHQQVMCDVLYSLYEFLYLLRDSDMTDKACPHHC
jgi:hypothetical protein